MSKSWLQRWIESREERQRRLTEKKYALLLAKLACHDKCPEEMGMFAAGELHGCGPPNPGARMDVRIKRRVPRVYRRGAAATCREDEEGKGVTRMERDTIFNAIVDGDESADGARLRGVLLAMDRARVCVSTVVAGGLYVIVCPVCDEVFGVSEDTWTKFKGKDIVVYCPSGHTLEMRKE